LLALRYRWRARANGHTPECCGVSGNACGRIRERVATFEPERRRAEWSEQEWYREIGPTLDGRLDAGNPGELQ
jgi:hypothetical protein